MLLRPLLFSTLFLFWLQLPGQCLCEDDNKISADCSDVHSLANKTEQCIFVKTTESCGTDGGYINYIVVLYCKFQDNLRTLGFVLYVLWFMYLLLATAVTSDRFFAPNLPVISDALHLSENVAGETLMALGNGAPDFFTSLVAALSMKGNDAGILYGTLLGSGTFVTTVMVATIVMIRPFKTMERPLLKDLIFYMIGIYCAFGTLWDGKIYVWEACMFLMIYIIYVISVLVGPLLNKVLSKWMPKKQSTNPEINAEPRKSVIKITIEPPPPENDKNAMASTAPTLQVPKIFVEMEPVHVHFSDDDSFAHAKKNEAFYSGEQDVEADSISNNSLILGQLQALAAKRPSYEASCRSIDSTGESKKSSPKVSTLSVDKGTIAYTANGDGTKKTHLQIPFRPHAFSAGRADSKLTDAAVTAARGVDRSRSLNLQKSELPPLKKSPAISPHSSRLELGGTWTTRMAIRRASSMGVPAILRAEDVSSLRSSGSKQLPSEVSVTRHQLPTTIIEKTDENEMNEAEKKAVEDEAMPAGDDEAEDEVVKDRHFLRWILEGVNPIEMDEWETQNLFSRLMQVAKAPIILVMLFTNPVVDEEKPQSNWNRPISCLHCVISPIFVLLAIEKFDVMLGGRFPLIVIFAIIGLAAAIAVFFTSENTKKPKYHLLFALFGFVTTVIWIYVLANEVVNLLQCFGLALTISQSILGLTCLAWGNSLGDLINNTIIARQGYSKMAISSCYGGMLFNLLLGLGVPLLIVSIKNGGMVHVQQSNVLTVMFGFIGFELACSFVAISIIQKFYVRRPFAIFLYCIYTACITCAILTEVHVISPNIFSFAYS